MTRIHLLEADGGVRAVPLLQNAGTVQDARPSRSRQAFAAAHVIPVPWGNNVPGHPAEIDWDRTLAFRHHIWACGLGVADAMDTAQRNMGLNWEATAELIRRSCQEATAVGGRIAVGVNTDHLGGTGVSLQKVTDAYRMQLEVAEDAGAQAVLMASRHLAGAATCPADYERVYDGVLRHAQAPVILHWLGPAFDPVLEGYFGDETAVAMETVVRIIEHHAGKVAGIKMSLLDPTAEVALRDRLPEGVAMFTGDDYNYVDLIGGDERGHSDALLGAFAAFPVNAALGIGALDYGDRDRFNALLRPTETLARHIFRSPTQYYKTGVAFLSWLNGHQPSFSMVGGLHSGRSLMHLSDIVRLANDAGVLEQPELAAERWNTMLSLHGA